MSAKALREAARVLRESSEQPSLSKTVARFLEQEADHWDDPHVVTEIANGSPVCTVDCPACRRRRDALRVMRTYVGDQA